MGGDSYAVVKDDDTLQCRTEREDAVCLVILVLLTNKEEAYPRILHHILNLLFTGGSIDGNRHCPNAIRTKIGIEVLDAVLRENGDVLLGLDFQTEHCVRYLLHAQRELLP